jgi:hypothetical protein
MKFAPANSRVCLGFSSELVTHFCPSVQKNSFRLGIVMLFHL